MPSLVESIAITNASAPPTPSGPSGSEAWKHNDHGAFDTIELAWSVAPERHLRRHDLGAVFGIDVEEVETEIVSQRKRTP